MPKKIPIKQAKAFAIANDLKQVIIAGWDGAKTHIVTYGDTVEACDQAALGGNKIKKALGWPTDLNTEPSRVTELKTQISTLEGLYKASQDQVRILLADIENRKCTLSVHHTILLTAVHVIEGTEYERGWGQRPDGYIAFLTEEDARAYAAEYDRSFNNETSVPYEYTKYGYVGLHVCSQLFYNNVLNAPKKFIHFDKITQLKAS